MQKLLLLTSIFSIIPQIAFASLEDESKPSCASMGYKTPTSECISSGGTPLLCPFAELNNSTCICLSQSCRGFPLLKDGTNYYYLANDGTKVPAKPVNGKVEDYIDGTMETCTVGFGEDEFTYYRVPQCKENFLYQNNICDEGCDTATKYPYNYHPGNLPGEVEKCVNTEGEWYGYKSCNDGWVLSNGKCNLNSCDIMYYPYMSDPNANEVRGVTATCKIGGNSYYKYTSCNEGYTLSTKGSVCIGNCEINTSCTKTTVTENNITYNNWKCGLKNPSKCRIGDNATMGGKVIGTVVYISADKTLIMGNNLSTRKWGNGVAETTDVANLTNITDTTKARADFNGKQKTYAIKAFAASTGYDYPAASVCYNYSTSNCNHDMCLQGEWYLPSLGELGYMYDNRYILWQVTGQNAFYNSYFWSSAGYNSTNAWLLTFDSGVRYAYFKYYSFYVGPVLAF